MDTSSLFAVSPIDGRYQSITLSLRKYFSEYALIRYRIWVEIEYFIALSKIPLPQLIDAEKYQEDLRSIYKNFTTENALRVKEIEKTTNHDVKAVEYFLREEFSRMGLEKYIEFIHFGLTSQDINNTAQPLALKDFTYDVLNPALKSLINHLTQQANDWKEVTMLARTHGQPASPTTLGKEIYVFVSRLQRQFEHLENIPFTGKFGGATGNFNAHHIAFPEINWRTFADDFLKNQLQLIRQPYTTQIENYDDLSAYFDALKRINTILVDLCRDIWQYISMNYFKQALKPGEVGSSAMPHKVNPIDFENAEGNLTLANAILGYLSEKLPVSRLQRDLTDSTVSRNFGVPLAHTFIAIQSIDKGLKKLMLNQPAIDADLLSNPSVIAEAIQTILRRENYPNPYEVLKQLTRTNQPVSLETLAEFIDQLNVSQAVKEELKRITPLNYTGITSF